MNWSIFFILLLSSPAIARDLPVKELVSLAEARSLQIKAEALALDASEAQLKQSRLIANPLFTFQGGSLKSATQSGPVADLTLNQPFPWPGKRAARIEASEFYRRLFELSQEEVKLEVSHRVFLIGAEVALLQELEEHYKERKRRFGLIEKSLRSRPQASPRQKVDRDLIESQIHLMEKNMLDLLARKESLLWELRIVTGSDLAKVLYAWEAMPVPMPKENYLGLMQSSPRYQRLTVENKIAANRIEQARLEARPDIVLGMNYRQENISPVNHFYHGQVSVVLPLIDRGQHSMEVARAEHRRMTAYQTFQKEQMLSQVHQSYAHYEANKKAMDFFRLKNLHDIENKFYQAEDSFRKGFIDALTFLQIDAQVHENIDQIYLTRLSYLNSISQLNLLVGKGPEL